MLSNDLLLRVRRDLAQYPDAEVEFRFGTFGRDGSYVGGISRRTYDRFLKSLSRAPFEDEESEDFISGSVRKRVVLATQDKPEQVSWISKDRLYSYQSDDYPFRLSISREKQLPEVKNYSYTLLRRKHRRSFFIYSGNFRVDLTRVEEVRDTVRTSFEVELEVLSPSFADEQLRNVFTLLVTTLLDTNFIYTQTIKANILNIVNKVLGGGGGSGVDPGLLMQSRNLKLEDLVWGGLVGNPSTSYSVTHKADGIRKLLVFATTGTWLIMPPNEVNLLTPEVDSGLVGTILDGEEIPKENRTTPLPDTKYWFMAFDCLSYAYPTSSVRFDVSVQRKTLNERLQACQIVADRNKSTLLYVNSKTFYNFNSPETFYKRMREMFSEQPSLGYKQDGFIFTPLNVPYNPHSDKFPLHERVLTRIPDNCKWKPPSQLTIDLAIRWVSTPQGRRVEVLTSENRKYVPFTGTRRYPLEEVVVNEVLDVGTNTIIEFRAGEGKLVPIRVREKLHPNRKEVALDVWKDAHEPLTEETLKGDNFVLVRRYHNRIKRDLLDSLEQGSTLLDLGSGKGADISKWRKLKTVFAIEPSSSHIQEMISRLLSLGYAKVGEGIYLSPDKYRTVYILQNYAQDTEAIVDFVLSHGGQVDAVSSLLSTTFFWESQEILSRVLQTIKQTLKDDGTFLYLTIDGNAVLQTFEPEDGIALTRLDLGRNSMYISDVEEDRNAPSRGKRLTLEFPDMIIDGQTEPLVFLEDIMGEFTLDTRRADKEKLLTPEEAIFTNLYSYGKGKKILNLPERTSSFLPEVASSFLAEDEVELLPLNWQEDAVRIGVSRNNSLLSSVLQSFYPQYRNTSSAQERAEIVLAFREELALTLSDKYLGLEKGALASLGLMREEYSLPALVERLNNPGEQIGKALYPFLASSFDLDLYLVSASTLKPTYSTGNKKNAVVLLDHGNEEMELIGLVQGEDIFTTFAPQDPFIQKINASLNS
ncbi:7-methylguanosine mRNA capping enzyme [Brazilian cedratvirus IHUMI]|uniref:7-methylguanosine mRNA capping enzyme n=1 Tax=Brazilian cedratvirus IHUMI TaxID=2126980 RepID=A0A2R8FDR8_9VIRU|nr:7-methylguanosine mRNA capping enzyme [Brazilian cedratvirus IHUMI]